MKAKNLILIAALFLCCTACKKEKPLLAIDYSGDYLTLKTKETQYFGEPSRSHDTIEIVHVTVIDTSHIQIFDLKLTFDSETKKFQMNSTLNQETIYRYFTGYFVEDSIYISSFIGGLSGGTSIRYKGKKI